MLQSQNYDKFIPKIAYFVKTIYLGYQNVIAVKLSIKNKVFLLFRSFFLEFRVY